MQDITLLKNDIIEINIINETIGERYVLIHTENVDFFINLLKKDYMFTHYDCNYDMHLLDLIKITQEDISILQEYLDYLTLIGGRKNGD